MEFRSQATKLLQSTAVKGLLKPEESRLETIKAIQYIDSWRFSEITHFLDILDILAWI